MRLSAIIGVLFLLVVMVGISWFGFSRTVDRWRVCRGLSHGVVYCVFAEMGQR